MDRPPLNEHTLIAFASGELSPEEGHRVSLALAGDPAAAARVALLRGAIESLRSDDAERPASEAVARVQGVVRSMLRPARRDDAAVATWWEGLIEVAATLFFDSRSAPGLTLGLRGSSSTRELSYRGDGIEVDLGIEPQVSHERSIAPGGDRAPRARLVGQISVHAGRVDRVAITSGLPRRLVAELTPDSRGVFMLALERGRYDLLFAQGDRVLTIDGLEVE